MKTFNEFQKSLDESYQNGCCDELVNKLNQTYTYYQWEVTKGPRWLRLFKHTGSDDRSAVAFIDKHTGEIRKAGGWKAPAKKVWGHLNDLETFIKELKRRTYTG